MMTANFLATSVAATTLFMATLNVNLVAGISLNVDMEADLVDAFEQREKRAVPVFHKAGKLPLTEHHTHSVLFGYQEEESPVFPQGDGSVNCFDEQGNEIGFFCMMQPSGKVEGGATLRANRNADLCADKKDSNDIHCHGSPQNNLYRHVIVDHMNRGYNGRLSCQCGWPPVGYVSDCDVTSSDDSDRYDNGKDGVCPKEDHIKRITSLSWGAGKWGNLYICDEVGSTDCDDFIKFQQFVSDLGLGAGTGSTSRRRNSTCEPQVTKTPTANGGCSTKTVYCNGVTSTMTSYNSC